MRRSPLPSLLSSPSFAPSHPSPTRGPYTCMPSQRGTESGGASEKQHRVASDSGSGSRRRRKQPPAAAAAASSARTASAGDHAPPSGHRLSLSGRASSRTAGLRWFIGTIGILCIIYCILFPPRHPHLRRTSTATTDLASSGQQRRSVLIESKDAGAGRKTNATWTILHVNSVLNGSAVEILSFIPSGSCYRDYWRWPSPSLPLPERPVHRLTLASNRLQSPSLFLHQAVGETKPMSTRVASRAWGMRCTVGSAATTPLRQSLSPWASIPDSCCIDATLHHTSKRHRHSSSSSS